MALDFRATERKWQEEWQKVRLFEAEVDERRPKFLITFPYPYLNGSMHIGHSYSFFRTDAYARYKRMKGFNVLFPQGFHATGEPIMGTVERLRNKDRAQIDNFRKAGASDEDIANFAKGPEYVAKFWMQRWIEDLKAAGASIDWRRKFITTDLTPTYSRFIEWQYNTLRKKGYVVQGTHPVIYCPYDKSPTGDHDRYKGEGESPVEYAILKFELQGEGLFLPCATLRPETLYGVTNIWLNPDAKYVKATIDGEAWLLSESAAIKLADQQHDVKVISEIPGRELIGRNCTNRILGARQIPIYPASFVLPNHATGVVMSVPGHAPYDFIALTDLKKDEKQILEYKLNRGQLEGLEPLSIISLEGYGEFPAAEECKKRGIGSQSDLEKLEAATAEIYRKEFHTGVLKQQFGKFAGMKVMDAKQPLGEYFKTQNISSSIWEMTGEVVCRCMTPCHVKILENQWFLKFSDAKWKDAVKSHLKTMKIFPKDARLQMENTIDWLLNKACTRKGGLGTHLPWDPEWKVETLSDSTIYMAYYTISKFINENALTPEQLPDELLDFIFLNQGFAEQLVKEYHIKMELLSEMKKEFEYFYPVDLRNSGKDLLQNHLLFFLFHHAAIFGSQHQPRGISVNGYVTVEGEKMSKSKGNFLPVRQLLEQHGADLVRINICAAGENLDDADWRTETLRTYAKLLEFLDDSANSLLSSQYGGALFQRSEKLLQSTLERSTKLAVEAMEGLYFRTAVHHIAFEGIDGLRKYLSLRGKDANPELVKASLEKIVLLLCPFTPHFSEEIWHRLGNVSFCSISPYPIADESKISEVLEEEEHYLGVLQSDLQKIIGLKGKPREIRIFVAEEWKRSLLKLALLSAAGEKRLDLPVLIKQAISDPAYKPHANEIPKFLQALGKTINHYKEGQLPQFDEFSLLLESAIMLGKKFECGFEILSAENAQGKDPENKAARALPFKPAIYLLK